MRDGGRERDAEILGTGLRRLLLRLVMRLQARTMPCMSWAPDDKQRAEAEAAGRRHIDSMGRIKGDSASCKHSGRSMRP